MLVLLNLLNFLLLNLLNFLSYNVKERIFNNSPYYSKTILSYQHLYVIKIKDILT
jgi:hypothetical protein